MSTNMRLFKEARNLKTNYLYSFFTKRNNSIRRTSNFIVIMLYVLGLFISQSDAAILQPRNAVIDIQGKLSVVDIIRNEPNEHEPPVTSSDLPKQIPAPPRPHFASTPHYEQQLARFVWVTPQYNTPSYPIVNQVQ